jgi:cell wall-associated NlpC family hydrolase
VPLRSNDSELSEMTSQLLFGERVEIIETRERWLLVRNLSDNYVGWVDAKMITLLTTEDDQAFKGTIPHCVSIPLLQCKNNAGENMTLPGGSLLPFLNNGKCVIGNEEFTIESEEQTFSEPKGGEQISILAKQYLNAPQLWGGKTILGIDCSGLVQVAFSIGGIFLPRNTSQQVELGEVIDFLSEAKVGDLAFFENAEGKIIHVGIMLNSHQIIHVYGCVKIETIDYQGIISAQTGEYTYKLRVIKRLL